MGSEASWLIVAILLNYIVERGRTFRWVTGGVWLVYKCRCCCSQYIFQADMTKFVPGISSLPKLKENAGRFGVDTDDGFVGIHADIPGDL